MISRLTAVATSVAILATASLAFATSRDPAGDAAKPAATPARVVQLPTVVVVAKRQPA